MDEAERSLHDALCVLSRTVKETKVVCGGGSSEMLMANAVQKLAATTPGKESMAIESFAKALRQVKNILLPMITCVTSCRPLLLTMLDMIVPISFQSSKLCTLRERAMQD